MRRLLVVLTVATTMVAGMQAASAAVRTEVTIHHNATTERFHGIVDANDAECVAGRVVKVFKVTANGRVLRGKDRANSDGMWRLSVMHAQGHFFAVSPRYKAMHVTCARDRSKTIDVM